MKAVVWAVSLFATVVLLLRMASLIYAHFENSGQLKSKFGGLATELKPFKEMEGFVFGFGWSAIIFFDPIPSPLFLLLITILSGFIFLYVYRLLLLTIGTKELPITFNPKESVGMLAKVVQLIPPRKYGKGKIELVVGETNHELEAITNHVYKLEKGISVKIIAVENSELMLVSPE